LLALSLSETKIPREWSSHIIVKVCPSHGIYAPLLEDDRCDSWCNSLALFATFAEFYDAIKPKNVVRF